MCIVAIREPCNRVTISVIVQMMVLAIGKRMLNIITAPLQTRKTGKIVNLRIVVHATGLMHKIP